jgi:hypothetical protein
MYAFFLMLIASFQGMCKACSGLSSRRRACLEFAQAKKHSLPGVMASRSHAEIK